MGSKIINVNGVICSKKPAKKLAVILSANLNNTGFNPFVAVDGSFNLIQFNPEPPQFDLIVETPKEGKFAIGIPCG